MQTCLAIHLQMKAISAARCSKILQLDLGYFNPTIPKLGKSASFDAVWSFFVVWAFRVFIFCCLGGGVFLLFGRGRPFFLFGRCACFSVCYLGGKGGGACFFFCCLGGTACFLLCCLGRWRILLFAVSAGGVLYFLLFGRGTCFIFAVWAGTGVHSLIACLAGL